MFELLSIILKNWKKIGLITIIAAIITAGVSLLLPNYYQSTVVFQPASPATFDRYVVFPEEGADAKISVFGGGRDADRVITVGTSQKLYSYIIDKYKLFEHYEISETEQYARYKLMKVITENYKIQKNALGSLEIIVLDKDPEFAATMANDIYIKIDSLNRAVILSKKHDLVKLLEQQNNELKKTSTTLRDSIINILSNNPNDTIQVSYLNKILSKSVNDFANVSKSLEQNKAILNMNQSTLHLYEAAYVADRKESPKRSLIVIGAAIFTFLIMVVVALFTEKYSQYKTEEA